MKVNFRSISNNPNEVNIDSITKTTMNYVNIRYQGYFKYSKYIINSIMNSKVKGVNLFIRKFRQKKSS